MNIPVPVSDWEFESRVWNIEGHKMQVDEISTFHPTIQHGLEQDEFSVISGAELYGMLRAWHPAVMLITPTDPVHVCLIFEDSLEVEYYALEHDEFFHMKDYFVGERSILNWKEEGF